MQNSWTSGLKEYIIISVKWTHTSNGVKTACEIEAEAAPARENLLYRFSPVGFLEISLSTPTGLCASMASDEA
jgi:hypothetical protein